MIDQDKYILTFKTNNQEAPRNQKRRDDKKHDIISKGQFKN